MRTLIKNITMTPGVDKEINIPFINDAVIQIQGNRIIYAGKKDAAPSFSADKIIDGKGNLAMPGMVNLHTHTPMTLLRSVGGALNLEDWLNKAIFPREKNLTDDIVYTGTQLGALEMLRFGTTSFNDMYMHMEAEAKAVEKNGMRATLGYGVVDFDGNCADLDEGLQLVKEWDKKADGRIRTSIAPHSVYITTEKLLLRVAEESKKLNVPVHIHVSETETETQTSLERFKCTPVQWLEKNGILDCEVIAAHCVWLNDEDINIIKNKNFTVVHNPISNLKLASGIAPIYKYIEAGIPVAIGTDGVASNNNLNLWEEMKSMPLLQKGLMHNPLLITPAQAFRAATKTGAEAMGYNNLGLIKEGYLADIILVSLETSSMIPLNDLENDLIYAANGSDVTMTMVDGKILYKDGEYFTLDKKEIYKESKIAAAALSM